MIKNRPPVPQILAERAKYLRSHMTPEERHLWYDFLRTCGYKFNRQYVIGNYIVDFYSPKLKLIIELMVGSIMMRKQGNTMKKGQPMRNLLD